MSTLTAVARNAEGFLERVEDWDRELALEIAREAGIAELTDRHWLVVNYMRDTYIKTGTAPTIRTLGKESGVQVKELYALFPKGPAKLAAKIGGIPKPKGCI
ncbi:MAG: sulfur relay protein DsrC [Gemmatimonas sp.]|nr:sulfur relay protein DsrC [Gemmatimonas sp.]